RRGHRAVAIHRAAAARSAAGARGAAGPARVGRRAAAARGSRARARREAAAVTEGLRAVARGVEDAPRDQVAGERGDRGDQPDGDDPLAGEAGLGAWGPLAAPTLGAGAVSHRGLLLGKHGQARQLSSIKARAEIQSLTMVY